MAGRDFSSPPIPGKNFLFLLEKGRKIFRMETREGISRPLPD